MNKFLLWLPFYLILLTLLVVTLLSASPAEGREDPWPNAKYRIHNRVVKDNEPTLVIIQGPRYTWGAKQALHRTARRVPGLESRNGNCRRHREAACIRIRIGWWNPQRQYHKARTRWMGLTIYQSRHKRVILLNRYYRTGWRWRHWIGTHEIGHALGLSHHRGYGALGGNRLLRLSWGEIRALRRVY